MRRVSRLAALTRSAAAVSGINGNVNSGAQHRLVQTAVYGTNSFSNKAVVDNLGGISRSAAHGVAGLVFFSAAASPAVQEVYAKEAIPNVKFDEVVLYQYEACPFCNKVKGEWLGKCLAI